MKRTAAALNEAGRITQKHGIKVIVHNHTVEFAPLAADVHGGVLVPHRRIVVEGLLEVGPVGRADVGGGCGEPVLVEDRLHFRGGLAAVVHRRLHLLEPDLRHGLEGAGVVGREAVAHGEELEPDLIAPCERH